jgi:hypothetical protein
LINNYLQQTFGGLALLLTLGLACAPFKHGYNTRAAADKYLAVDSSANSFGYQRAKNLQRHYKSSDLGRFLDCSCRGLPNVVYETTLPDRRQAYRLYFLQADSVYFFSEHNKNFAAASYDSARPLLPTERSALSNAKG